MSALLSWVLSFGARKLLMSGAIAIGGAVALWLWNDYQDAKAAVVLWERQYNDAQETYATALDEKNRVIAQKEADLVAARQVSKRRAAEATELRDQLAEISTRERPHEDQSCPVHPAINFAIERLWDQAAPGND